MIIPKLSVNDVIELKKEHPCGGRLFRIMRIGSDIRIICLTCSHDMTLPRVKLERSIKKINPYTQAKGSQNES